MQALESWLYGGHPEANLQVGGLFDTLRAKMADGYFEDLLRRLFLENPHRCKVELLPSHTAGEARRQAEADRLARESAAWTPEQKAELQQLQQRVDTWQKTPDSPEQLAALPLPDAGRPAGQTGGAAAGNHPSVRSAGADAPGGHQRHHLPGAVF